MIYCKYTWWIGPFSKGWKLVTFTRRAGRGEGGGDGEGGLMEVVGDEIFPTAHLIYGPFVYKFFIILTFYKYVHILFIRFSAAIYDTWCISLDALRNSQIELGIVYVDRGYQLEKQVEVVYCS